MQQNIHKRGVYNVLTKTKICIYKKASINKVRLQIKYKMLSLSKQCLIRLRKLKTKYSTALKTYNLFDKLKQFQFNRI